MIYRAYFNRHREAPQVWSIDEGEQTTEVNVIGFECCTPCSIRSVYNGEKVNDDSPSAWIQIESPREVVIRQGIAYFGYAWD